VRRNHSTPIISAHHAGIFSGIKISLNADIIGALNVDITRVQRIVLALVVSARAVICSRRYYQPDQTSARADTTGVSRLLLAPILPARAEFFFFFSFCLSFFL